MDENFREPENTESDRNNDQTTGQQPTPPTNPAIRALINSDPLNTNSLNNPNPITDLSRVRGSLYDAYRGEIGRDGIHRDIIPRNRDIERDGFERGSNLMLLNRNLPRNTYFHNDRRYKPNLKRSVSHNFGKPQYRSQNRNRQRHSSTSSVTDDKLLTCPICKNTFKDPYMLTTCGHTFCFYCIKKAQSRDPRCPVCLIEVKNVNDASILVQNITIDNLIQNQQKMSRSSSYCEFFNNDSSCTLM